MDAKQLGATDLVLSGNIIGGTPYQSGAFFSFDGNPSTITLRVGVSFVSAQQACANAQTEIGSSSFEDIMAQSKALWNEKLSRIELDVPNTDPKILELFYSSLYRTFLTPNNATEEGSGLFADTTSPFFDTLYCSWDVFRTYYPLMSLHSAQDFADIAENYIDGWRKNGVIPEVRLMSLT